MTLIFRDLFAEAANTPLESHTPDLGDGWLVIYDTAATVNVLVKPVGHSQAEDVVGPSGSENSVGMAFAIQPAPGVADVTLTFDRYMLNWEVSNSYSTGVFARHSESGGNHTFYGLRMVPNLHSQATLRLYKVVNNSGTLLGEYDHTFTSGDVITFECHDAVKRVLVNGVERITSTDNAIAGPGNVGIWWGTFTSAAGTFHMRGEMEYSFFEVDAPAGGGLVELAAAALGEAIVTALSPSIARGLAADVAGEAVMTADLSMTRNLSASAAGGVVVGAGLAVLWDLVAPAGGSTTVTASPDIIRGFAATVAGEAVLTADLDVLSFVGLGTVVAGETMLSASLDVLQMGAVGDVRVWIEVPDQAVLAGAPVANVRMRGELLTVSRLLRVWHERAF